MSLSVQKLTSAVSEDLFVAVDSRKIPLESSSSKKLDLLQDGVYVYHKPTIVKILVQNHFCSGTTYTVLTEDEKGLIMQCTAPSLYGDTELKNHDNQTILTLKAPQFWTLRSREMNVSINSRIVFTFSTPHWTFTQRLLGYIGGKGGKPFSKAEYTTTTEQNGSIGDSICTIGPNGKQTEIVTWMEEPVGAMSKIVTIALKANVDLALITSYYIARETIAAPRFLGIQSATTCLCGIFSMGV